MKKVVLLGDSIRLLGYGTVLPEMLKDEFEVWQPTENCRFAQYLLRGLFDWRTQMKGAEIVHFNAGHWDLYEPFGDGTFTPLEDYVKTVVRIARILQSRHKTVIFATTCPTRSESNELVIAYNAAVVLELQKMGVIINDLYTAASDTERCIRADDLIHLTEEGSRICAEQTAYVIRKSVK